MTRLRSRELPKFYYPPPDELQGAKPLWEGGWGHHDNRGSWFDKYQELLVDLANTDYGRDLLCIDKLPYPVTSMLKNVVVFDIGRDALGSCIGDFRVGCKWGNVIRYRWLEVKKALDQMNMRRLLSLPRHLILPDGRKIPVSRGAASLTEYPDAHPESDTVDGFYGREVVVETFATIRGGAGAAARDAGATSLLGRILGAGTTDRWAQLHHGVFGFDTSIIGTDTADSGTFSVYGQSVVDNLDQGMGLMLATLASHTAVAASDWANRDTTAQSDTSIDMGSFSTSAYNDYALNSTGLGNVATGGVTEYTTSVSADIGSGTEPTWGSGTNAEVVGYFAEQSGTSNDPKLVIEYSSAFTPKAIIF